MHDWLTSFHAGLPAFPLSDIAIKAFVATFVGLFVGLEREWSNKDIGVRTFALTSLLGFLSSLEGASFSLLAGAGILILIACLNVHSLRASVKLEATTSVALIIVFVLGALVGDSHLFTSVAGAVVVVLLLSLKPQLHAFAGGLRQEEVRSAVLLALLGFVIWPVLPHRFIDPWNLLDPKEAWIIVVVVASLGFINYVLLRIYGSRALYLTAVLGGFINSTATVAELTSLLPTSSLQSVTVPLVMLTSVAMFLRNLLILAVFSRRAALAAFLPLFVMALVAAVWIYRDRKTVKNAEMQVSLSLASPLTLKRVLTLAGLFLGIQIAGTIAQRIFGSSGLQLISILGGLVSSASTTAAAADLVVHGKIAASAAGLSVVLASISSLLFDLPIIHKQIKDRKIVRNLWLISLLQASTGIAMLVLQSKFLRIV